MMYEDTGLPLDNKLYRKAYVTGVTTADRTEYMDTALDIVHLMLSCYPECNPDMIAAVLVGPAIFCSNPTRVLGDGPVSKAREVMGVQDHGTMEDLSRVARDLAPDVRCFIQVTAVAGMKKLLNPSSLAGKNISDTFIHLMQTYMGVRDGMGFDEFSLDSKFNDLHAEFRTRGLGVVSGGEGDAAGERTFSVL